ncbi:unnamed protein product [Echinostoma caproni]|uniref:Uncharacterized protein n=1 Tax=Echinostoma caproni TaxID=27848 RepID=A0A183B4V5_9TREM|nr:unnamed protein product [Echinostoma caproni]
MSLRTELFFFYNSPRQHLPWTSSSSPRLNNTPRVDYSGYDETQPDPGNQSDLGAGNEGPTTLPRPVETLELNAPIVHSSVPKCPAPPKRGLSLLGRQQQERYFRWMNVSKHILSQLGDRMHTSDRLSRVRRPRFLDYQLDATWEELIEDTCLDPRDWQTPGLRNAYETWLQVCTETINTTRMRTRTHSPGTFCTRSLKHDISQYTVDYLRIRFKRMLAS